MSTLYSVAGALGRGSFNVIVNTATAYVAGKITDVYGGSNYHSYRGKHLARIVAIDTAFRIAITHVLDALRIPFLEKGTVGHLLFPCLTLLTQPLSVRVTDRYFDINEFWRMQTHFHIELFGYIALGWKANMMIKDILYLTGLAKV